MIKKFTLVMLVVVLGYSNINADLGEQGDLSFGDKSGDLLSAHRVAFRESPQKF